MAVAARTRTAANAAKRHCMACKDKERTHPRYAEAVAAECDAVQRGNTNFLGIGKPGDL